MAGIEPAIGILQSPTQRPDPSDSVRFGPIGATVRRLVPFRSGTLLYGLPHSARLRKSAERQPFETPFVTGSSPLVTSTSTQ